ncbi:MAG: hypothetical protein U1C57_03540 [Candidatus Doudnabacteria bacterium]|nr:hypothetical protein [bacterium]MDZ4244150.1 hypothetical protein [Candidatus Doudnabacteria bacterium]
MDQDKLADILRILKLIGGKFIIVEEGEPKVVLMDYQEFQNLAVPSIAGKLAERISEIEDINKQITKAQLTADEGLLAENTVDEVRIEPLDAHLGI